MLGQIDNSGNDRQSLQTDRTELRRSIQTATQAMNLCSRAAALPRSCMMQISDRSKRAMSSLLMLHPVQMPCCSPRSFGIATCNAS